MYSGGPDRAKNTPRDKTPLTAIGEPVQIEDTGNTEEREVLGTLAQLQDEANKAWDDVQAYLGMYFVAVLCRRQKAILLGNLFNGS